MHCTAAYRLCYSSNWPLSCLSILLAPLSQRVLSTEYLPCQLTFNILRDVTKSLFSSFSFTVMPTVQFIVEKRVTGRPFNVR